MILIKLIDNQTERGVTMFDNVNTKEDAERIVEHFNRLNKSVSKLTGVAINFTYKAFYHGK
jgi:hypothetical protein